MFHQSCIPTLAATQLGTGGECLLHQAALLTGGELALPSIPGQGPGRWQLDTMARSMFVAMALSLLAVSHAAFPESGQGQVLQR